MKIIKIISEISFGEYGGAECFFSDIDNDGFPEIITYQGPGVFGAEIYSQKTNIKPLLPHSTCISAFRFDGTRIWTWGKPNPPFYISHAYEAVIAIADIDADGKVEVIVADGKKIFVLDGTTGEEKNNCNLLTDNFYIVHAINGPTTENEATIVVKNGEGGYNSWRVGEPVIGLNSQLVPVWGPKAIPGGGHYIISIDIDNDGKKEFLIGYCAVNQRGKIIWIVDSIDDCLLDPNNQHVDYTDIINSDGNLFLGFAGSDKFYLTDQMGHTIFSAEGPHVQGCTIGHFRSNCEFHIAVYNKPNGPLVLYDSKGKQIWSRMLSHKWPFGIPECCKNKPFHRNKPVVKLSGPPDYIGFTDGGWPQIINGSGEISIEFEPPLNSRQEEYFNFSNTIRADDLGYGFKLNSMDIDKDGKEEIIIYDRRFLWVYKM